MPTTKFEPFGGRVLVRREEAAKKTEGGIYLPPSATTTPTMQRGVVLGFDSAKPCVHDLRVGDTVAFAPFAGQEIEGAGLLLGPDEVLGRFRAPQKK